MNIKYLIKKIIIFFVILYTVSVYADNEEYKRNLRKVISSENHFLKMQKKALEKLDRNPSKRGTLMRLINKKLHYKKSLDKYLAQGNARKIAIYMKRVNMAQLKINLLLAKYSPQFSRAWAGLIDITEQYGGYQPSQDVLVLEEDSNKIKKMAIKRLMRNRRTKSKVKRFIRKEENFQKKMFKFKRKRKFKQYYQYREKYLKYQRDTNNYIAKMDSEFQQAYRQYLEAKTKDEFAKKRIEQELRGQSSPETALKDPDDGRSSEDSKKIDSDDLSTEKEQRERMISALRKKDGNFFRKIEWDIFQKINQGKKRSFIFKFAMENKDDIVNKFLPTLVGGFKNKDIRVREKIYEEVCFGCNKDYLHNIDFNILYGILIKQKNAKKVFDAIYSKSLKVRSKEQGNLKVWNKLVDIGTFCKYANMKDNRLRQVMYETGLKAGLQIYFHKIMWEHWQRVNTLKGKDYTYINSLVLKDKKNLAKYMWVLMGVFRNKDPKVRKGIYQELMFPGIKNPLKLIRGHKNGKKWLMKFRLLMSRRVEQEESAKKFYDEVKSLYSITLPEVIELKNRAMLATLDPDIFKRTNVSGSLTHLGKILSKGYRNKKAMRVFEMCLKAVIYKKGNPDTQKLIMEELLANGKAFYGSRPAIRKLRWNKRYAKNPEIKESLDKLLGIIAEY